MKLRNLVRIIGGGLFLLVALPLLFVGDAAIDILD